MRKQKTTPVIVVTTVLGLILAAILTGILVWKATYPYGARPACFTVMVTGLYAYAQDNGGWFPAGGANPWESLRKMRMPPDYLAGISGDRAALRERLESGEMLDSSVSSWVYFPGFRNDDPYELAIIWERQPGIAFNGQVAEEGSHAVGFAHGYLSQVSGAKWSTFLQEQEYMRKAIQAYHSEHPEGGPMPDNVKGRIWTEIRESAQKK